MVRQLHYIVTYFIVYCRFVDRVFISTKHVRSLLVQYAYGGEILGKKKIAPLPATDKKELFATLQSSHPGLYAFLEYLDDGTCKAPSGAQQFLFSLASTSPVCGYIHPTSQVEALIQSLTGGSEIKKNPTEWTALHEHLPLIFQIMEQSSENSCPQQLNCLLADLWEKAQMPFEENNILDHEIDDDTDELAFFPSLMKCRNRGRYLEDSCKTDPSCRKSYSGHPTLLPGLFTLYCPHGK